jgi:hypothetical protein
VWDIGKSLKLLEEKKTTLTSDLFTSDCWRLCGKERATTMVLKTYQTITVLLASICHLTSSVRRDLSQVKDPLTRIDDGAKPLRLTKIPINIEPRDRNRCCFDHITTSYDEMGDPIAAVIDNFLCDPDKVRGHALGDEPVASWQQYYKPPEEAGTNNAFPGWRGSVDPDVATSIQHCGSYAVAALWPEIPTEVFRHAAMPEVRHVYGLATVQAEDMINSQRLAHTDVDFQYGTDRGSIPKGLATVYGLTHNHNKTGTAFFREKGTGISLMKSLPAMENLWGSVTKVHKDLELDFRDGIT